MTVTTDRGPLVCGAIAALMRKTNRADPVYAGMQRAYAVAMTAAGFDLPLDKVCVRCGITNNSLVMPTNLGWLCTGWDSEACQDRAASRGQTSTEAAAK